MKIEDNPVIHGELLNQDSINKSNSYTEATDLRSVNTSVEKNKINLSFINISICTLAVIAIVASMYLAQAFVLPVLIGILASYTLSPVVEFLNRCHIPRAVGAALVVAILIGALTWLTLSLSSEATAQIGRAHV